MKNKIPLLLLTALGFSFSIQAQEVIKLYNGKAPGSENWKQKEAQVYSELFKTEVVYNVTDPSVLVYKVPEGVKNTGTAMVIAPGGGFQSLSINREGIDLAKRLSEKGITAFVLKYRLLETISNDPAKEMMDKLKDRAAFEKSTAPLIEMSSQDGKKALQYVYENASRYGIKTNQIGIIGFSAGSTVAMQTVLNNNGNFVPNFAASIYGGVSAALLQKPLPKLSTPLFVCAATDDQLKLAPRSIQLYNKWLEGGYPAELHMYEKGGHGFGMGKQNLPVDSWVDRFEDWLKYHKLLN
ncbi:alpha/beta hydrolase [Pedobacter sp. AJM]|uniref:alpha/beta hydrolase n=1 Tax=Pedobacter sp. AJM TaxID=2003629 RepID=UPI000B4A97A6|nr:alpha/beta hydrolase [Pedobacter sp. AJM]OWK71732.1 esterase [Pedobacter sp. AJM]